MKKLKTFDSFYFRGKSYFEEDGTQNWLVFQPVRRYFKTVNAGNRNILSWKSKDCLMKVLRRLQHQIEFLILH